ncbi:carboxypeptidase-like regulatory domain-containing protein [Aurantibacter crassamenti]|uniref:carboxypeptidase-like regulatory domain-containing protein n=1 Tax=Aurantibacter crassamenti TaxID=1837375 RepID=UPI00193931F7|nr:carboxypeptidase-like regulatory domain-containing protein [Aurantibacter crassamenti]MBM1107056.1 carboxypeptidase-like regulatory domain-containing protein [Aurantibacter crassamenti]
MRTIFYILIIFQLFSSKAFSQEIVMNGIVIDSENQEPIEFVNIGVQNKNQGTITNSNGKFNLRLPKEYKTDSVTVSHINYYSVKILAQNLKNQTILLEPKTTVLSEVVVSNKKIKNRKIGVKSYNRLLSTRVTSKSTDIIELAQLIKVPTEEAKVKAVNFNIRKWSKVDGVKVRINFYENVDNYPSKKIIQKNIIQEIPTERESDWIRIDLNNSDIYITQDFFIGIEFIPNFNNPTIVDLGGILTKGKGYRRESSLGTWEKLNGGASINVEIAY